MCFKINVKCLSGWLSPDGEFIPSIYRKHDYSAIILKHQVLNKYNLTVHGERLFELLGYIKFVCMYNGAHKVKSYMFFPQQFGYTGNITTEQIKWIYANFENMSELQQDNKNLYENDIPTSTLVESV